MNVKNKVLAILLITGILFGMMPGTASASVTVSTVNLSLNVASIGLNIANKEANVEKAILQESSIIVHTQGLNKDLGNSGLSYWNESYNQIHGLGSSTELVKETRQYYARVKLKLSGGYDWADAIKKLPNMKDVPIKMVPDFMVIFNGEEQNDAYVNYNAYWNDIAVLVPIANDIMSGASVTLTANIFTYDGTVKKPEVESVIPTGGVTALPKDCDLTYTDMSGNVVDPVNAGQYYVKTTLKGKGIYGGSIKKVFQINKASNTMTAKGKKVKIKKSKLRKKKLNVKPGQSLQICNAVGDLNFKFVSINKKKSKKFFKVNTGSGKITIKKGLQKGNYKLKINITAAGDANYLAAARQVTVTIMVK